MGRSALIDVWFRRRSKAFKRYPLGHWLRQKWGFIMWGLRESKCGLKASVLWFSDYCARTNVEFILNPFRSHPFFFSTFFPWQFGFLHSTEACLYDSLPAPLSPPPSRSLQPRGGQLASPSGCLLSGSEGSSKCALAPRLSPPTLRHRWRTQVTSPPPLCCTQAEVAGGQIINLGALRYVRHLPATLPVTARQPYVGTLRWQTHKQKLVQAFRLRAELVSLYLS